MNVLSADGGGIRGIITIRLLEEIEKRTEKPISELFDFCMGSSISTLLIAGLLCPDPKNPTKPLYTAKQIKNILINNGSKIFSTSTIGNIKTLWGLARPKYSDVPLQETIIDLIGNIKFSELLKPCVFPSKDTLSGDNLYIYNQGQRYDMIDGSDVILADLLCGTTAAPTYFPSKSISIDKIMYNLIDGGVVINNPSELAFLEARKILSVKIYELSVGTGKTNKSYNSKSWGIFDWVGPISNILIDSNSKNQEYELSLITDSSNYDRINPTIPNSIDYMDRPEYITKYIEITEKWILNNSKTIDKIVAKLLE